MSTTAFSRTISFVLVVALVCAALDASAAPGKGKPGTTVSHTARQARPIPLGVSGGGLSDLANGYCCSGTLGALVQDVNGVQYILSNTHVFAGDSVSGGNGLVSQVGDAVNQPGYVDVSCDDIAADYVASVSNWMPLPPGGTGVVDAAIAQVIPGAVDPLGSILEIGTISSTTVPAFLNQAVKKSGRTSGLTRGSVVGLDATISVSYSDECAGNSFVTTFNGQILVSPGRFLKGGDSGSLMVEDVASNPRAVGLLYAGSTRIAVAAPIGDALNAFGVELVGTPSTSASSTSEASSTTAAVQRAARAKAAHAAELASIPGAVGHAVGLGGGNAAVIQVLVEAITPEARQAKPATADGVPVVLMEVGKVVAY